MPATQRYDVPIRIQLDPQTLGDDPPPTGREIRHDMLACNFNLEFRDRTDTSWEDTDNAIEDEAAIIETSMARAEDAEQLSRLLDAADDEFYDEDVDQSRGGGLDLGVRGAVFALNAAGCPTFTSCAGHDDGRGLDVPYVAFYANRQQAEIIVEAARTVGVGICPADAGGIEVNSDRLNGLLDFAKEVRRRAADFDRIRPKRRSRRRSST